MLWLCWEWTFCIMQDFLGIAKDLALHGGALASQEGEDSKDIPWHSYEFAVLPSGAMAHSLGTSVLMYYVVSSRICLVLLSLPFLPLPRFCMGIHVCLVGTEASCCQGLHLCFSGWALHGSTCGHLWAPTTATCLSISVFMWAVVGLAIPQWP